MFKGTNEEDFDSSGSEDTVIGSSIKIEGDLVSNGSINVEGEVVGSLKTERTLRVGEKARVIAEVKADNAFISGKVQGNITVQGKIELTSTAEVEGDIAAKTLIIAAGAMFNGRSSMIEAAGTRVEEVSPKEEPEIEE